VSNAGSDQLFGGTGDDTLVVFRHVDDQDLRLVTLNGGDGHDVFHIQPITPHGSEGRQMSPDSELDITITEFEFGNDVVSLDAIFEQGDPGADPQKISIDNIVDLAEIDQSGSSMSIDLSGFVDESGDSLGAVVNLNIEFADHVSPDRISEVFVPDDVVTGFIQEEWWDNLLTDYSAS